MQTIIEMEAQLGKLEEEDKKKAIATWKHRVRHDDSYRMSWITKSRISYYPQVAVGNEVSTTKAEALDMIVEHDDNLKASIEMNQQQKQLCIDEMVAHFRRQCGVVSGRGHLLCDMAKIFRSS